MIRKPPRKPGVPKFKRGENYIFVNVLREVVYDLPPIPYTTPAKPPFEPSDAELSHVVHWMRFIPERL